ncbi:MAG: hypothetical protein ACYDAG_06960 [Chloroflexota bacterium]
MLKGEHWQDRFFFAGLVSSSLAGIFLGFVLGQSTPHDFWRRARRTLRVLSRRAHPNWEMLVQ